MASGAAIITYTGLNGVVTTIGENVGTSMCEVESRPLQIEPKGRECYIDGVRVEIKVEDYTKLGEAYFQIGWTDKLDDTINWYSHPTDGNKFYLDLANSVYDVRFEGRFVHFKIVDDQIQTTWKLSAIELYGRAVKGKRY